MGFVELEQFTLQPGVDREAFMRLDADVQVWSYLHRDGLIRRTTAFGEGAAVLVVTLFSGRAEPSANPRGTGDEPLSSFNATMDPATYTRSVFRDLD